MGNKKQRILFLLFIFTSTAKTSPTSMIFTELRLPSGSGGPVRFGTTWTAVSAASCVSTCMVRFSTCWSFMYNNETGLCTPGKWITSKQASPSASEGRLYSNLRCDLDTRFKLYINGNTLACLYLVKVYKSFWDARPYCKQISSNLFTGKTIEKFDILKQVGADQRIPGGKALIGLADYANEGQFVWTLDNKPLSMAMKNYIFEDIVFVRSKRHDRDCAIYRFSTSKGDDFPCYGPQYFICEKLM